MAAQDGVASVPQAFTMCGPGAQHAVPLRDAKGVALFYCGGLLASLGAIDDGEDFVGARSGISTHVVVIDLNVERAIAHHAAESSTDIVGAIVEAVVGANDL